MEDKFSLFHIYIAFVLVAFVTLAILRRLRFDSATLLIFCAAIGCSFIQFATTSPWDLSNDPAGHLDYIHTLSTTGNLPAPSGFQSQQPPLYYAIAALFRDTGNWLGVSTLYSARMASVALYYGAALFSALMIRRFVSNKIISYLCLLLVLFWPVAIPTSVKVTNDVGLLFFAAGFIYFLTRWVDENKPSLLAWAIVFTAGGIATKGSGVLLIFVLACTVLWRLARKETRFREFFKKSILIGLLCLVCGLSVNFGRTLYWRVQHNADVKWLINRDDSYIGSFEYVGNSPTKYLVFDYGGFIDQPYLRAHRDNSESHYFFNVFLKTLLFGDFPRQEGFKIAQLICFVFLLSLGWLALRLCVQNNIAQRPPSLLPVALMIVSSVVMVMCAHISVPIITQASGRYVYVCVTLFAILYGHSLSALQSSPQRGAFICGYVFLISFVLLCLLFLAVQWSNGVQFSSLRP